MSEQWAYVSVKVHQDDVPAALAEARALAVEKIGNDIELYEKNWTPGWLCTSWRRWESDPIPPT